MNTGFISLDLRQQSIAQHDTATHNTVGDSTKACLPRGRVTCQEGSMYQSIPADGDTTVDDQATGRLSTEVTLRHAQVLWGIQL